ncbi:hypothetical protein [Pseudomonas graminis]|uniref:hypothetical protein n=1 Tax=Pseudomonas graminis TaxID=158627 RepID=UPI003C261775
MKFGLTLVMRAVVPMLKACSRYLKTLWSVRAAANDPESVDAVDEEILDAAIRRMAAGQLDDSALQTFVSTLTGFIATPSF